MNQRKKIAILGGAGFLGARLTRFLCRQGHEITVFCRPGGNTARLDDLLPHLRLVAGEYSNSDAVLDAIRDSECVIHLIHSSVPASSMHNPQDDIVSNVAYCAAWLARLGGTAVKRVIYVSSGGTVYGRDVGHVNLSESAPTNPISSYGVCKLAIEKYVQLYCDNNSVLPLIIRPSNIYGEQPRLDHNQGLIGTLLNRIMCNQPLQIYSHGKIIRDYIYIDDVVSAIALLMDYEGESRVFNVGSGVGHSINDILEILQDELPLPPLEYLPGRKFDVPRNVLDPSLLCREVGWQAQIDLKTGIRRIIATERSKSN